MFDKCKNVLSECKMFVKERVVEISEQGKWKYGAERERGKEREGEICKR